MKLKNINRIILAGAVMLAANACEVNEIDPANRIPESVAYSDAARVLASVNGAYEAAQQGFYLGFVQRGYPFGAASTQQNDMRGEDMYNDQLFYEITYVNAWNSTTANNNGMWISLYRLINRVNVVMDGIAAAQSRGAVTPEVAASYRGEMLFLRALAHHELLIHFSRPYSDDPSDLGIPYRTVAIDEAGKVQDALLLERGSIQDSYTMLLEDLDEAEQLLGTTGKPFRVTQGAAIALKSRIKLHMEDWTGVLAEYEKIKTVYTLTATPNGPFTGWTSTESIFSFQNSAASNSGVNGALVSMYGSPALGGRGLVKISPVIWKSNFWVQGDLRRTTLTTSGPTGYFTTKYYKFGVYDDPTPMVRFAEVVLNAAEARARLNQLPEAIALLNSIRDRAKPGATPSYDLAALSGNQEGVLQGILNERRIEFLGEGKRWPDIHRLSGEGRMTGVPLKAQTRSVTRVAQYEPSGTVTLDHSLPYTDDRFVWPIPLDEILNNPTLAGQQNPGY